MATQKTFTLAEFADAAAQALDNWDWNVEAQEGRSPAYIAAMKEALNFGDNPAEYAANNWAGKDGMIEIGKGFSDVYDMLYEFAVSTADNAVR